MFRCSSVQLSGNLKGNILLHKINVLFFTNQFFQLYLYMDEIIRRIFKLNSVPLNMSGTLIESIVKLLYSDYIIFLTGKYFSLFNSSLLTYFSRYNIIYFNYDNKTEILHFLDSFNSFVRKYNINDDITKGDEDMNENGIFKISSEYGTQIALRGLFNDLKTRLNIKKLKIVYFPDNTIEPNTLYKKIGFSSEELFLSFENYIIKKREYKLRTFCQIAEKLGAQEIKINSNTSSSKDSASSVQFDAGQGGVGISSTSSSGLSDSINYKFTYNNFYHNLNLNKFYIINLIEEESEFLISKEDFYSDIDLKLLIDTRCINLIEYYNTNIIVNRYNELEKKVFIKAIQYGLNMGYSSSTNNVINLNIEIKFIDIYKNPECITGSNLYVLKEGFWVLSNIIKQENKECYSDFTYEDEMEDGDGIEYEDKEPKHKKYSRSKIFRNTLGRNLKAQIDRTAKNILESRRNRNILDRMEHERRRKEISMFNYIKINNFLREHLIFLDKGYFLSDSIISKSNNKNYINIFNDILMLNFSQSELNLLYKEYFRDNLIFDTFREFRNILIDCPEYENKIFRKSLNSFSKNESENENENENNSSHIVDKFYFICYQYHLIINSNAQVSEKIKQYIEEEYDNVFYSGKSCQLIKKELRETIYQDYEERESAMKVTDILSNNKAEVIDIILKVYADSYLHWYGLHNSVYDSIHEEAYVFLHSDFENKFGNLLLQLKPVSQYLKHVNDDPSMTELIFVEQKLNELLRKVSEMININYCQNNAGFIEEYICDILMKYLENSGDINLYKDISSNSFIDSQSSELFKKESDRGSLKYNLLRNDKKFLRTFPKMINVNKCNYTYNEYKIFYGWEDFLIIKNECVGNIRKLFIIDSETEDDTDTQPKSIKIIKELDKHILLLKSDDDKGAEIGEGVSGMGIPKGILKLKGKKQSVKLWNKIKKTLMINTSSSSQQNVNFDDENSGRNNKNNMNKNETIENEGLELEILTDRDNSETIKPDIDLFKSAQDISNNVTDL